MHDKVTRGQELSADEQVILEKWYFAMDKDESAALGTVPQAPIEDIQVQLTSSFAKIAAVVERIEALAASNESLRREVAEYKRKFAELTASQTRYR